MSYGNKLHILPTNNHLLAAQQEPHTKYKKPVSVAKDTEEFSEKKKEKKSQENGPPAQKMTRQAAGDVQWNANHTQTHPRAEWCATRILLLLGFNVLR